MTPGSKFWAENDHVAGWCGQVGDHGDYFQQRILKPFVLSCITTKQRDFDGMPVRFPKLHLEAIKYGSKDASKSGNKGIIEYDSETDISVDAFRQMCETVIFDGESEACDQTLDLSDCIVLDLGCGEGFMSRFLSEFGAKCVGFDGSAALIEEAKTKALSAHGADRLHFKHTDLSDEKFGLESELEQHLDGDGGDTKRIIILMMNVLDHIKDPAPILGQVASLTRRFQERATIVASTLNPFFFSEIGPLNRSSTLERAFQFPWSDIPTTYYPRDWRGYETIYFECGLDVAYFFNSDCDSFAEIKCESSVSRAQIKDLPATNQWPQNQGPFLLWRLCPPPEEIPQDNLDIENALEIITNGIDFSERTRGTLLSEDSKLKLLKFRRGAIVVAPGERCRGIYFVHKGSLNVKLGPTNSQQLSTGQVFGDLESEGEVLSGRFLYEIECGEDGAECLMIPSNVVQQLIGGTGESGARSLGDQLFASMRRSFNTFTPTYHRPHHGRANDHPDKRVGEAFVYSVNKEGKATKRLSTVHFEHLIRSLLTLISIEETRSRPRETRCVNSFREPSLLLDDVTLGSWLRPDKKAKDADFANGIKFLHNFKVVDCYPLYTLNISATTSVKKMLGEASQYLNAACAKGLVINLLQRKLNRPIDVDRILKVFSDEFVNHVNFRNIDAVRDLTTADKLDVIKIYGDKREHFESAEKNLVAELLKLVELEPDDIREIVQCFIRNVVFSHWAHFSRERSYFVVIRDLPFLRRAASGGNRWLSEAASRIELHQDSIDLIKSQDSRDKLKEYAQEERFRDYLEHLKVFSFREWSLGNDLDFSGVHRLGQEPSWKDQEIPY